MKTQTIAEKAQNRMECQKAAGLIVAEYTLFDLKFGEGALNDQRLTITDEEVETYFHDRLSKCNNDFLRSKLVMKSMISLSMFLACEYFESGYSYRSINIEYDTEVGFIIPSYSQRILKHYESDRYDRYRGYDEPKVQLSNDAMEAADRLLNYVPICQAMSSIVSILENASEESVSEKINSILSETEPECFTNFQHIMEMLSFKSDPVNYSDLDREMNGLFKSAA